MAEAAEGDNCRVATHPENGVEVPTPIQILAEDREYRVDAFSDIFDQPDEADDIDDLRRFSPTFCNNPAQADGEHAARRARLRARASSPSTRPNGQALFAGTAAYHDADPRAAGRRRRDHDGPSRRRAGRAGARARARAAQASHLVNAAAVASSVGLPSEALAMLDAAERLEDPDRPAMGIGRHAVALNNRGAGAGDARPARRGRPRARRRLGRRAAAERGQHEPRGDHGLLARCPPAAKFLRAGRHRQPQKPLDSSRGKATELRKLELPGVPKEAAQMRTFFQNQAAKLLGEITAQNDARQPARGGDPAPSATSGRAPSDRRYNAHASAASTTPPRRPTSARLDEAVDTKLDEVIKIQRGFWGDNEREDHEYRAAGRRRGQVVRRRARSRIASRSA